MGGYSIEHELQRGKISIIEVLGIMGVVVTWYREWEERPRRGNVFF